MLILITKTVVYIDLTLEGARDPLAPPPLPELPAKYYTEAIKKAIWEMEALFENNSIWNIAFDMGELPLLHTK